VASCALAGIVCDTASRGPDGGDQAGRGTRWNLCNKLGDGLSTDGGSKDGDEGSLGELHLGGIVVCVDITIVRVSVKIGCFKYGKLIVELGERKRLVGRVGRLIPFKRILGAPGLSPVQQGVSTGMVLASYRNVQTGY
jgi:hypothetical protein